MDSSLTIISYNCRGAMSATMYLNNLLKKCDILCLQEHHLFPECVNFFRSFDPLFTAETIIDLDCYDTCTKRIRKGGVAIMWRKSLDYCVKKLDVPKYCDRIVGICLTVRGNQPIYIINVYMPASSCEITLYYEILDEIQLLLDTYMSQGVVLIGGDLNGQLGYCIGRRPGTVVNDRGKLLNKFMLHNNLESMVSHSNCIGPLFTYYPDNVHNNPSQIDHFLMHIDQMSLIKTCQVEPDNDLNMSDHVPITIVLNRHIPRYKVVPRTNYNWRKADLKKYIEVLECELVQRCKPCNPVDVDNYLSQIQQSITVAMESSVPQFKYCSYKRPFWDAELAAAHKEQKTK